MSRTCKRGCARITPLACYLFAVILTTGICMIFTISQPATTVAGVSQGACGF